MISNFEIVANFTDYCYYYCHRLTNLFSCLFDMSMHMHGAYSSQYQTGRSTTDTLQSGWTNCRLEQG
jgi:hypothetical protein